MLDSELKTLASFEWAYIGQYMVYITSVAGLDEINSDHVISFPLAQLGPEKLIARKTRVQVLLEGNIQKLERFVGAYREQLDESEVSVLRSLYRQYKCDSETVKGHLVTARQYKKADETGSFLVDEGVQDDIPF